MSTEGKRGPPAGAGAQHRIQLADQAAWGDEVLPPAHGRPDTCAPLQQAPSRDGRGAGGATIEPGRRLDAVSVIRSPSIEPLLVPSSPRAALLSPIKPRFGITDVDDPAIVRTLELGEPQPRALPVADAIDEPEMATRVGPDFQADVPAYLGRRDEHAPLTPDAEGAPAAEPELVWAPHFEGVIRDLSRLPPRAEIERYEELRRRQQKPCGIPGCLLHDKHPGPHVFPEPSGKRRGKAPWRGSPRPLVPPALPKPKSAPRRAESLDGSGEDESGESDRSSVSDDDDDEQPAGTRLNADRAAAREAREMARGARGRKRERQQLNYRAFGGIMPRGAAVSEGATTMALLAAKAAKGDTSDRHNVGLMRRASSRHDDDDDDSRYERVPVRNTRTGAIVRGRLAPMRLNVAAYLERYPECELLVHADDQAATAAAAAAAANASASAGAGADADAGADAGAGAGGRRGRGRGRGAGGGRGRGRWGSRTALREQSAPSDDESDDARTDDDVARAGNGDGDGCSSDGDEGTSNDGDRRERADGGSSASTSADEDEAADGALGQGAEMTQERVNELFAIGSRVCAYPGCCKIYASTDGVRKHAKRCHMAWVLERDREKEGVWLEPMPSAADPQLYGGGTQAHPAKKHGQRAAGTLSAYPSRRSCAIVPWTLADKRARADRDRQQIWPPGREEWLSLALLDASGWLLQPGLHVHTHALDGPLAKRPRPDDSSSAAAAAAHLLLHEPCATLNGGSGSAHTPRTGPDAHGEWALPVPLGTVDSVRAPAADSADGSSTWDEVATGGSPRAYTSPRAAADRPKRPSAPVPGSRAQLPGLWPDCRPLPPLDRPLRPLVSRVQHVASRAARMALHELLATPALRQLYFAAAGHAAPQPLQLTRDTQPLHARPDQLVRLVYWRRRASEPARCKGDGGGA